MALTACRECNHEVSDKASRCPHCGAPTSMSAAGKRRLKRSLYGLLIAVILVWAGLTALWFTGRIDSPSQLADLIGLHKAAAAAPVAVQPAAVQMSSNASAPTRSVYQTSIEQLYQDYNANAVATQNRIGDSRVRVTGNVIDINQDTTGHPIVTLSTTTDLRADMILNDDQRSAVAQLTRGDAVDVQCDRMQRIASAPHGSDCALVLVDAGSRQVYLAIYLSNTSGNAPAYVVGPMAQGACLAHEDTIASQLNANPKSDHISSRNCNATTRESIALDGCHLSTTMSAIPDVPSAHLWKYDCGTPNAANNANFAAARKPVRKHTASQSSDDESQITAAAAILPAPEQPPAPAPALTPAPAPTTPTPTSSPSAPASAPANITLASASGPADGPSAPAAANPPASASPQVAGQPDDLGAVRASDPGAADHIATYCSTATASATDHVAVAAGCRRSEAGAWTRLVLNNEFPTLDDATRLKCNQPPFPDSYVAKESCAKYQLHIN